MKEETSLDDPSMLVLIAFLFVAFFHFLNSLLRAGYYGLGRISLLAFVEKIKDKNTSLWSFLEEPIRLKYSLMVFDTVSLVALVSLGMFLLQTINTQHVLAFLGYMFLFNLVFKI